MASSTSSGESLSEEELARILEQVEDKKKLIASMRSKPWPMSRKLAELRCSNGLGNPFSSPLHPKELDKNRGSPFHPALVPLSPAHDWLPALLLVSTEPGLVGDKEDHGPWAIHPASAASSPLCLTPRPIWWLLHFPHNQTDMSSLYVCVC